jgi:hypothetical protein
MTDITIATKSILLIQLINLKLMNVQLVMLSIRHCLKQHLAVSQTTMLRFASNLIVKMEVWISKF